MIRKIALFQICAILLFSSWKILEESDETPFLTIQSVKIFEDTLNEQIQFTSGMNIDADGSPRAYHPVSDSGTDNLANAGKTGNWWGIVVEKGVPIIQGKDDPAPGFYVSTTSLQDPTKKLSDPNRYVNSDSIPFLVLPNNKILLAKIRMGDIALVKNLRNGKSSFAICADVGPTDKIGEGSIRLAEKLGVTSSPRKGGVSDSICYKVYEGSGIGKPLSVIQIDSIGLMRNALKK